MKNSNPLISLIMIGYNAEKYLEKALGCIETQTFTDFEFIFVNNGSTDNTQTIIDHFHSTHTEIPFKLVRIEKNDGLPKGRNAGLVVAEGTYIMIHDVDDWMDSDCLQVLAAIAHEHKYSRIMQGIKFINDGGSLIETLQYAPDASPWSKFTLQGDLFLRSIITDNSISFSPEAYYDDFYFSAQFTSYVTSYYFINEPHYNMLMHSGSMTHRFNGDPDYFTSRLDKTFSAMTDIAPRIIDHENLMLYEYDCIQRYYSSIFGGPNLSLKEKLIVYSKFKAIMKKYYPNYLNNSKVTFSAPNGFTGHFKRNIWISVHAEKIDKIFHNSLIMSLILIAYHIALKIGLYKYM